MLLQGHAGEIRLLPALPHPWPDGGIEGLRSRGGWEVDLAWRGGKATTVALRAELDGAQHLRPPKGQQITAIRSGCGKLPLPLAGDGTVTVDLRAGNSYDVEFG